MEATNGYNHEDWDTYYKWEPELAIFHQKAQEEQNHMFNQIEQNDIFASQCIGKLVNIDSLDRVYDIRSGLTDYDESMHFLKQINFYQVMAEPRVWRHQTTIYQLLVDLCGQLEELVYIVESAFEFSPEHAEQMIINSYVMWRWHLCRVVIEDIKKRVDDVSKDFGRWARQTPGEYGDIFPPNSLDQENETDASEVSEVRGLTRFGAVALN
ncbi:uncharacterized protein AKAW2_50574A [Aspergillus luchuensis]|uniref:Similar to An13g04010 n=1 Tax=Aspergillus kawachii TaxID=1069201 RepID=A0A146FZI2_ASPKA|nr:uncharacterized protein AKAW2_50574A [Aspergillus luchuensis]BCS00233.1 hypothetical protein AKAW2_50574A [Aspergillus luchuensis]BCS12023.1 hypothetical protein ALUC_50069A [Aspergillus luchuensis]GAT31050.1 similar to An13g04010 [Aspergillus luchuensis]